MRKRKSKFKIKKKVVSNKLKEYNKSNYIEDYPNEEQVKQLMTLSLHLIQRMKPLCEQ